MNRNTFTKSSNVSPILALAAASFLCGSACQGQPANSSLDARMPIEQKRSDLLCGIPRAVCYSGFRHGQHPDRGAGAVNPSDKETLEDLQILGRQRNFGLMRLYDSRDNSEAVLRLIQARQIKMKVMQSAMRLANQYSNIVVAVSVGNEALVDWNDHMVPADSVIRYVRQVKKSISQPVTVADNYAWWARNGSALAKELDFISVHTYPIWEGKDVDQAMAYTVANLQAVRDALPGSRIVITEAGWATVAKEFGPRASEEKQQRYYHELYAWTGKMNITTFWFEAFDEDWKGEPNDPLGAEKHWGLVTVDRGAKSTLHDLHPALAPMNEAK